LNDEKPRLLPLDAFATDAGPLSSKFQGVAFMVVWKRNIQPYLNAKGEFEHPTPEQNLSQLQEASTPSCGQKRRSTAKVLLPATKIAKQSLELDDDTATVAAIQAHFLGRLKLCGDA
jgi:hypothetical protein